MPSQTVRVAYFIIILRITINRYQLTALVIVMSILSLPVDHQEQCQDIFKVFAKELQLMDRTIVVISPLLALMREQQEKLEAYSFKSICLDSSQAIDVGLLRRLDKREFRAVFMTLESILSVGKSSGRGKTPMDVTGACLDGERDYKRSLLMRPIVSVHGARTSARPMFVSESFVE
ncbi:hypothetical protein BGZ47_005511 [Haplosporangium gracile]|nr:hypothetical protein BGZ47_005511 [Haplosporangium gracile]